MYNIIFIFSLYFLHSANGNDCDKLGTIIYEDIGCKPVIKEGEKCPIKYECDLEVRNNTCLFRNQQIGPGERVSDELVYGNCHVGCTCLKAFPSQEDFVKIANGEDVPVGGVFTCAILDCPEHIGGRRLEPGCYRTYDLNKCCSTGQICETPGTTISKCTVTNGETVLEGQRFYPPNSCLKCVCPKDFNGKLEAPHCKRMTCAAQIRHQKEISDHCAPFYSSAEKELCCPTAWVCPRTTDKIVKVDPKDQDSELKCKFGSKTLELGEWLESIATISWSGKEIKAKCECILPPFLTCRDI